MTVHARRDRERELRRQSILDAAERIYVTKGPDATMDDIATAAEVAKGTLYLYYASKEDLWLALIGKALSMLEQRFRDAAMGHAEPEHALTAIGDTYVRFSREHTNMFRLLLDSTTLLARGGASPAALVEVGERSDALWSVITGVLQTGIDRGDFRDDIGAFEMAIIFWSNTSGLLRHMDASMPSDFRRHRESRFSLDTLDFFRLIDVSNSLLLESLRRRPADAASGVDTAAATV